MNGSRRTSAHKQSMTVAFSGTAAALSVVLMLTGGLIPVMTYISPLAAGVILLPVMMEFGKKYAWTCWLAAALIVLLLGIDREAAFFYLFFGWYPLIKWQIDRRKSRLTTLMVKTALFTVCAAAMYGLMALVMGAQAALGEFGEMGTAMTVVFFVMLVVCMLIFDRLLLPAAIIWDKKVKPRLKLR